MSVRNALGYYKGRGLCLTSDHKLFLNFKIDVREEHLAILHYKLALMVGGGGKLAILDFQNRRQGVYNTVNSRFIKYERIF